MHDYKDHIIRDRCVFQSALTSCFSALRCFAKKLALYCHLFIPGLSLTAFSHFCQFECVAKAVGVAAVVQEVYSEHFDHSLCHVLSSFLQTVQSTAFWHLDDAYRKVAICVSGFKPLKFTVHLYCRKTRTSEQHHRIHDTS